MGIWRNPWNKLRLNRELLINSGQSDEYQRRRRYLLTCAWRYRQITRGNTLGLGW